MKTFVLLFLTLPLLLTAEIMRVDVNFNRDQCDERCMRFVSQQFKSLPEASTINVSPGLVSLTWMPGKPFTFNKVDNIMRRIGLGTENVTVRVRGTIVSSGSGLALLSLGDNTKFVLVNPPQPSAQMYIEFNNVSQYVLLPQVKRDLDEARMNHQIVTVSGTLIAPWGNQLTLVLGNYHVEESK